MRDAAGLRVACGYFYASGATMHPALLENQGTIVFFFVLVVVTFVVLLVSTLHSIFVPVPLFKAEAWRSLERKVEVAVFGVLLLCQMMVSWSTFHSMDDESRMVKGKVGVVFFFLALVSMLLVLVLGENHGGGGGYAAHEDGEGGEVKEEKEEKEEKKQEAGEGGEVKEGKADGAGVPQLSLPKKGGAAV